MSQKVLQPKVCNDASEPIDAGGRNMSKKMFYHFLSSAARRQYAEDIIRALALPRGAHLQFRYSVKLMAETVRKEINEGNIEGSECVISFLHSSQKGILPTVIPCRRGKIVKAGFFGPFAVIVFSVDDFVFSQDARSFSEQLREDCDGKVPEWETTDGEDHLKGHWALSAPIAPKSLAQSYDFSLFASIVESLSELYPFNEEDDAKLNPFFHVSIFDQSYRSMAQSFSQADLGYSIRMKKGALSLEPGADFLIRVYHFYPGPGKHVRKYARKLTVNLDGLAPQYADQIDMRVTSEYDVKEILFRTLSSPFAQHKRISIFLERTADNGSEGPFADIELPVSTKPAVVRGIATALFVGVGVAMPAIIGASFRPEFSFWSAVAMGCGGLLAGGAAVYGLRRSV